MLNEEEKITETYREINSVLMTSDYTLYRVDRHNFNLVGFSNHFNTICPKAKVGDKCYHALYGREYPCDNCPLKTSKKMLSEIAKSRYETSLTMNESNTRLVRMLLHRLKDQDDVADRFDRDLLINSYSSLNISLSDLYSINARGSINQSST